MRTYDILDQSGAAVSSQTMDDSMAPALISGQTAQLTHVDGELLAKKSRPLIGVGAGEDDLPKMPDTLVTEAEAAEARAAAKAEKEAAKAEKAKDET